MATTEVDIKEWERAEIKRSGVQAARTQPPVTRDTDANIQRYLAPGAGTCYPLEYAFHLLGDARDKSVLELGCGSGENSHLLAHRGARVWAMDISESLTELARRRAALNQVSDGVTYFVASAYDIPLPDESVDVVFGIAILHHLDLELAAREVRRVLKKGGRAIFQEPVRNSRLIRGIRRLVPYHAPDVSPFERPLTDRELETFAAGFSDYHSRSFMLPYTSVAGLIPILRDHTHKLLSLDRVLLDRFVRLGYYAGIRVVEMVK
jgi:SAM-dependent methyltransferase